MATDNNEIVVIEMNTIDKVRLGEQIRSQMEKQDYTAFDYSSLKLGFHLPIDWPAGKDCELTLSQLVVLAKKLGMKITIVDMYMEPHRIKTETET